MDQVREDRSGALLPPPVRLEIRRWLVEQQVACTETTWPSRRPRSRASPPGSTDCAADGGPTSSGTPAASAACTSRSAPGTSSAAVFDQGRQACGHAGHPMLDVQLVRRGDNDCVGPHGPDHGGKSGNHGAPRSPASTRAAELGSTTAASAALSSRSTCSICRRPISPCAQHGDADRHVSRPGRSAPQAPQRQLVALGAEPGDHAIGALGKEGVVAEFLALVGRSRYAPR